MSPEKKTREIVFEFRKEKVAATLLWEEAPNICRTLWQNLPLNCTVNVAKICSNELMIMVPLMIESENMKNTPTVGDVGWWDERSNINIFYGELGPLGPLGPTALFARIDGNLEDWRKVAERNWFRAGEKVRILKGE